jgi:vacuolar protein-sorting-associated protein 4
MSSGQQDYIQKGIRSAEQATAEDKAQNYEAAAQHYMTAADWLMQAMKYGIMNPQMKQTIRPKIESYVKRAEEIKEILKHGPGKKKAVADSANGRGNSKDNKGDDDDSGDPDKKRMMQRFEGAIVTDPNVTFADVIGLDQAKEALKEAVILPVKFPQLFQGKRKPWAGILLYGPPGTGKSYLAKAIATECKSTFISVSSSDLLSKWLGESEKGVKCLFELARERQPCIVFIDEIDALCGQRNDTESESSRRVKTEFLVQMQGVGTDNSGVLVLAATNIPWTLDTAIRRRFEKRIYIPLPGVNERAAMFKTHLGTSTFHTIKENEWMQLAQRSEHYSGADIAVVCREALLRPIRRLGSATHFKRVANPKSEGPRELWLACSPGDPAAEPLTLDKINPDELCEPPVTISDMMAALVTQKPTVGEKDLLLQKKFTEEFGQEGS